MGHSLGLERSWAPGPNSLLTMCSGQSAGRVAPSGFPAEAAPRPPALSSLRYTVSNSFPSAASAEALQPGTTLVSVQKMTLPQHFQTCTPGFHRRRRRARSILQSRSTRFSRRYNGGSNSISLPVCYQGQTGLRLRLEPWYRGQERPEPLRTAMGRQAPRRSAEGRVVCRPFWLLGKAARVWQEGGAGRAEGSLPDPHGPVMAGSSKKKPVQVNVHWVAA